MPSVNILTVLSIHKCIETTKNQSNTIANEQQSYSYTKLKNYVSQGQNYTDCICLVNERKEMAKRRKRNSTTDRVNIQDLLTRRMAEVMVT